jgi:hypothetical protein
MGEDAEGVSSDGMVTKQRNYLSPMSLLRSENNDISEDRRRLDNFKRAREAIPLGDVKAWVESWGTDTELPRPKPQRLE